MRSHLVLGTILSFSSIIIVSASDLDSDLSLAFPGTTSVSQDIWLPWNQADELSATQPTSLFDQAKLSEGSEFYPPDATGFTSLPLDPNELLHDPAGSSLNQPLPFLDETALSGGSESYLDNGFDSLFESDVNSKTDEADLGALSDHILFDNSFELADCATLDSLPAIGQKSRLRRLDDSGSCKNPTTTPPSGADTLPGGADDENVQLPDIMKLLNNPYFLRKFGAARRNQDHNSFCYLFSEGILPWGVCSSGKPEDQRRIGGRLHLVTVGFFDAYELSHCTLSTFSHPNIYSISMYASRRYIFDSNTHFSDDFI